MAMATICVCVHCQTVGQVARVSVSVCQMTSVYDADTGLSK